MRTRLHFEILPQPDLATCGPTCLHAIYHFYRDPVSLDQVIRDVPVLEEGGTLAVFLACHALRRGYDATIYTYNLQVFDPTWFQKDGIEIPEKLRAQARCKKTKKLQRATAGYLEFFELGGKLKYEDLTQELIESYLSRSRPILTGLSATYLYRSAREVGALDVVDDDIRGEPSGHFVVLCGIDKESGLIQVADPINPSPLAAKHHYTVSVNRVIGAIMLGIITYDANLLIIEPKA